MTVAEFGPHLLTARGPRVAGKRWTPERDDVLKRLWASDLSASQVAAELGEVTRNAVIGRVHRLGLSGRIKKTSASSTPRARKPRSYVSREAMRAERLTHQVVEEEPEPVIIDEEIPAEQRKTIFDLQPGMCRWPVGTPGEAEFFFCAGQAVNDRPYCSAHCCASYQPARARRDQQKPAWRRAA